MDKGGKVHDYQDLIRLFKDEFYDEFNTLLVKGEDEPIYMPANDVVPYHQIVFAHGYFTSALHETSHWCIAGQARRLLEDYGYWYCPDGRTEDQQNQFQQMEIRPQSVDWLFCLATNVPFYVSCDNLEGDFEPDHVAFRESVRQNVIKMLANDDIPPRAARFLKALNGFYGTEKMTVARFIELSAQ